MSKAKEFRAVYMWHSNQFAFAKYKKERNEYGSIRKEEQRNVEKNVVDWVELFHNFFRNEVAVKEELIRQRDPEGKIVEDDTRICEKLTDDFERSKTL